MEVHFIESTDIYLNLALEQKLFLSMAPAQPRLLVWKNQPAVVMGRFQNPWLECDLSKMRKRGVKLARRQSGGGTVYHDLGNMNICFMDWNDQYSKERNNQVLIGALKEKAIESFASGRSDLMMKTADGPKKISGAAFKQKKDRSFHHCTMLLSADLNLLNEYLNPKLEKISYESKAIASVRSKVANTLIPEEEFKDCLVKSFEQNRGGKAKIIVWSEEKVREELKEDEYLAKLLSWEWVFGETPMFEVSLEEEGWKFWAKSKKGLFKELELEHSQVHPAFLEEVSRNLTGVQTRGDYIQTELDKIEASALFEDQLAALKRTMKRVYGF